ncbi:Uncharacterised protein [Mycobacteroides abscessus subsp. abscessus]|nr:Uncharacterised protein [Mycobacteroides abscessus subsp. abscessus]
MNNFLLEMLNADNVEETQQQIKEKMSSLTKNITTKIMKLVIVIMVYNTKTILQEIQMQTKNLMILHKITI